MADYEDPGYGYERKDLPAYAPMKRHASLGEAMYGAAPQPRQQQMPQQPPKLTTGPIVWDEKALAQARAQQPARQMLQYWPGFGAVGALGIAPLFARGLMALLRDPRLEMMFRK